MAVLHGMYRESVLCIDVECGKTCGFITQFMAGGILHEKGPKIRKVGVYFGPFFSILRFLRKFYTVYKKTETKGNQAKGSGVTWLVGRTIRREAQAELFPSSGRAELPNSRAMLSVLMACWAALLPQSSSR